MRSGTTATRRPVVGARLALLAAVELATVLVAVPGIAVAGAVGVLTRCAVTLAGVGRLVLWANALVHRCPPFKRTPDCGVDH